MNAKPENPATEAQTPLEAANRALRDAEWAEQAGLPERAVAAYRKVAALCPAAFEVHNNLASLLLGLDRPTEALDAANRALALNPGDALVNANVGQAQLRLGQVELALPFMRRALADRPDLHPLRQQLADTLLEIGRRDEAVATMAEIDDRYPNDIEVLKMMASLYQRAHAAMQAERVYLRLLQLAPQRDATYNDLAQLYIDFAHFSKARDLALRALHLKPDQPALWNTLALAQASLGLVKDALASYRKVMEMAPNLAISHSNMLLTMHYSTDVGPAEMAEEHRRWGRLHAPPGLATRAFPNAPDPGRRLRVGYLSPDFRRHSVAFFFEPLLDHRNREQFEVYCYGEVRSPDEVTQRIKAKADHYRNTTGMHDLQLSDQIKADGVDILVDLAGHTGTSRTVLLGYRPAPVQVTYCGYPDTTGIEVVDYRITDALADPPGVDDRYTETLCRLPEGFLCFRPPESLPEVGPAPMLAGAAVTFGSFNREFKVSQDTYDLWCRILRAVPHSRMIMKSIAGGDPATRRLTLAEFERRGVTPDRIEIIGFIAEQKDHLASYRRVDIALDTYPYHGTTTTLDSLLMSVPVITLEGYNHASRVGVSLLTAVGLPEFIASSPDEYVAMAIELAAQPGRVAELHHTLRNRLLQSPLCDGPRFTRIYEHALRGMWCNWCRQQGATLSGAQTAMAAFDFAPLLNTRA
ncbi:MAG: tetratricopeptide repeat protein [Gammaproteobacteria bacterium]|nr:MAG: tetratricopeptide repeat protein [Gammaproteobacteria bacterium]